ncbi:MAG: SsrA-binding protein [Elusimicrobia bacterium CG_4_10_14_0_2_um_filter_56_8]|nr:MAG: SsrA-binding protein [Elusimicrobia bacterium CG1_02_56_21]PJA12466.1 MAG: SsrA-binding protein [Elusimicrobia bacterium CG_4_10_14_0_2_um_filter_56_8]
MAKEEKKARIEPVATNRKARHDYLITDTYEAGLALEGPEVKSLRLKQATMSSAFARAEKDGLYLYGLHIAPYAFNTLEEIDPIRTRKLLLKRAEIKRLSGALTIKGLTLVALELYFKNGWAKVLLGLAKGKKAADKHESIKKRDIDREMRREFKEKFKG